MKNYKQVMVYEAKINVTGISYSCWNAVEHNGRFYDFSWHYHARETSASTPSKESACKSLIRDLKRNLQSEQSSEDMTAFSSEKILFCRIGIEMLEDEIASLAPPDPAETFNMIDSIEEPMCPHCMDSTRSCSLEDSVENEKIHTTCEHCGKPYTWLWQQGERIYYSEKPPKEQ